MRRTELRRTAGEARSRRRPDADVPTDTRQVVYTRARVRCERCNLDLSHGGGHIHHRQPRQSGGTRGAEIHLPGNLLLVCVACHEWVERNRACAYELGLLVHRGTDPCVTPVQVWVGWQILHPTGSRYLPVPG